MSVVQGRPLHKTPAQPRHTSKNTMGLSLRIADFSSAFAFAGVLQATSCTPAAPQANGAASQQLDVRARTPDGNAPGMAWKYDSRRCECSAPSWRPTPGAAGAQQVRVLCTPGGQLRRTSGAAHDHGHLEVAAGGVVEHARVIRDLAESEQQETHVHALDDRAQARHGGAHAHALASSDAQGGSAACQGRRGGR